MRDPAVRLPTLLGRAMRRRCPRCGGGSLFAGWRMQEWCHTCGLRFEREQGYWVGAMIVDTAVVFALFLLVLGGGMAVTWPDVPWTGLLVATIGVNLVVPAVFYPWARMLWLAMELSAHPLETEERAAAAARLASSSPD